jgi:prefoldin subunit 5
MKKKTLFINFRRINKKKCTIYKFTKTQIRIERSIENFVQFLKRQKKKLTKDIVFLKNSIKIIVLIIILIGY